MTFQEKRFHICGGNFLFLRWKLSISTAGTRKFLPWNSKVPPLELESSSLGTKKFQEGNNFWNSYLSRI